MAEHPFVASFPDFVTSLFTDAKPELGHCHSHSKHVRGADLQGDAHTRKAAELTFDPRTTSPMRSQKKLRNHSAGNIDDALNAFASGPAQDELLPPPPYVGSPTIRNEASRHVSATESNLSISTNLRGQSNLISFSSCQANQDNYSSTPYVVLDLDQDPGFKWDRYSQASTEDLETLPLFCFDQDEISPLYVEGSDLSISDSQSEAADEDALGVGKSHNEADSLSSSREPPDSAEHRDGNSTPVTSDSEPHGHIRLPSLGPAEDNKRSPPLELAARKQRFRLRSATQSLLYKICAPLRKVSRPRVNDAKPSTWSQKAAKLLGPDAGTQQDPECKAGCKLMILSPSFDATPSSTEATASLQALTHSTTMSERHDGDESSVTSFEDDERDRVLSTLMSSFTTAFYNHLESRNISPQAIKYNGDGADSSDHGTNAAGGRRPQGRSSGKDSSAGSGEHGASGSSRDTSGSNERKSGDNGSDGSDDRRRDKRPRLTGLVETLITSKIDENFACPFLKHNPQRYRKAKSCPGPGWNTIPRLKEHLYRCHSLPLRCSRCGDFFTSEDLLNGHQRAVPACEVHYFPVSEGVSVLQKEKVRSRKRVKPDETEAEKWHRLYLILFPDADPNNLPSPHYDISELHPDATNDYYDFLRVELPAQVRQELAIEVAGQMDPMEDELRARLPQIVHLVHRGLHRLYHRNQRGKEPLRHGSIADKETVDLSGNEFHSDGHAEFAADAWLHDFWPMDTNTFLNNKDDDPSQAAFVFDDGTNAEKSEVPDFSHMVGGSFF